MPGDRSNAATILLWVDLPTSGAVTAGALVVSGWAFRRGGARIVAVEARVGDRRATIPQNIHRPDVALALGEPHADWSGFEGRLAIAESALGREELLVVRATDETGESAEVEVPVRVVPSDRPVLEIEVARLDGARVEVEGWLIWPESAPPHRVELSAGGARIAEARANLSRPDVARRFPAFASGSCRGFRLSGTVEPRTVTSGERAELRVVAIEKGGRRLEQTATVERTADPSAPGADGESARAVERALARACERLGREPFALDWETEVGSRLSVGGVTFFRPPIDGEASLPYLDRSVDLVLVDGADPERVAEARRVAAVATVEGAELRWAPAIGSSTPHPATSIVVCTRGDADRLEALLARLRATVPEELPGEILVVDDHSPDIPAARVRGWRAADPRLRTIRNEQFVGFVASCRRAAEAARGELLLFLDPECRPQPGWLPPLLRPFRDDLSVGAVGGKLLREDGTLLAAGGVLFDDGSVVGFGCGDARPDRPLFSFARDVDFCSNVLLAVRRDRFLELGGFDPGFRPADDEGVDFCLRLGAAGLRVRYQPASVVVLGRHESARAGPGPEPERPRSPARHRFRTRWRSLLARRLPRPETREGAALEAFADPAAAHRVLICAPDMPEYDRQSGSRRAFHLVELMRQAGWAVSYLALESVRGERYVRLLQERGVETFAGPQSLRAGDEYLDDVDELLAGGRFDLAILAFWSVAERLLPRFRSLSPATRLLVDSVDLHYLREERAARSSPHPEPALNAALRAERRRRELDTYAAADGVLTVSETEAETLAAALGRTASVFAVPDLEELERSARGLDERSGILFIGNFHHPPNLEGLVFLCSEILPRLDPAFLAAHPLAVVGTGADEHVRAAVATVPHARVVGWVPSVVPYLEQAKVSLVPMLHGAGTKRKLLQALMLGTPSVATTIGVEGLGLVHGRDVLVADTAAEFAAGIERLTTDVQLWNRLAREGRARVERTHGLEIVARQLRDAVDRTLGSTPRRAAATSA